MKITILGPPGSGKSTIAKELCKKFKLKHIGSGILKNEINKYTPLGKKFEFYIKMGKLIPGKIMNTFIRKFLIKDNFILDGYPRTLEEAKFLDKLNKLDFVIVLNTSFSVLNTRLLERAKTERRSDDTPKTIKQRFKVYRKQTAPLLKYYRKKIILVDGNKGFKKIIKEVTKILKNVNRNSKVKS